MQAAFFVVPVALGVTTVCCTHLLITHEQEEVLTERSTTTYHCARCRREVLRGNVLRYISDRLLCDRCWFDHHGRMLPADHAMHRSRRYRSQPLNQPLVAASMMRGSALLVFLNRRRG